MSMNNKEWDKLLTKVAKKIHAGKKTGVIDSGMVKMHAQELMNAITQGLGYGYQSDLSEMQALTFLNLQQNIYHFSGAKNWQQLREMSALLSDEEGNTVPFNKFLEQVKITDKTYNQTYLQTEYENAITNAQMISKWQKFEAEKEALPNLRWDTSAGENTCVRCDSLDGITLPFNHPFWKTTGVPRHFKCRCNIVQEDEFAEITDLSTRKVEPTQPMFKTNAGISGVAFSRKHPYFATIPAAVLAKVIAGSEDAYKFKKERLAVLLLDRAKQFEKFTETVNINGRNKKIQVQIHKLVNKQSESFARELKIAQEKAAQGIKVEMLPELKTEEIELFYGRLFPNSIKKPKTPDYRFNQKEYADLKTATGASKNTLKNNIKDAAHQCGYAIVDMPEISSWKQVKTDCRIKFNDHKLLHTIEVISGNKRKVYERKKLGL